MRLGITFLYEQWFAFHKRHFILDSWNHIFNMKLAINILRHVQWFCFKRSFWSIFWWLLCGDILDQRPNSDFPIKVFLCCRIKSGSCHCGQKHNFANESFALTFSWRRFLSRQQNVWIIDFHEKESFLIDVDMIIHALKSKVWRIISTERQSKLSSIDFFSRLELVLVCWYGARDHLVILQHAVLI